MGDEYEDRDDKEPEGDELDGFTVRDADGEEVEAADGPNTGQEDEEGF